MLKSISLRLCTLIVLLFAGICSFAQQVQVKGTVVEKSSGESIIGASVMEVGSNSNGTITDIDGNFTLSVASGATLSISYIGYKTVTVKAQSTLRIELTEDSQLIDEVVVTGYMSEKKGQPDRFGGCGQDEGCGGYSYGECVVELAGTCCRYEHYH